MASSSQARAKAKKASDAYRKARDKYGRNDPRTKKALSKANSEKKKADRTISANNKAQSKKTSSIKKQPVKSSSSRSSSSRSSSYNSTQTKDAQIAASKDRAQIEARVRAIYDNQGVRVSDTKVANDVNEILSTSNGAQAVSKFDDKRRYAQANKGTSNGSGGSSGGSTQEGSQSQAQGSSGAFTPSQNRDASIYATQDEQEVRRRVQDILINADVRASEQYVNNAVQRILGAGSNELAITAFADIRRYADSQRGTGYIGPGSGGPRDQKEAIANGEISGEQGGYDSDPPVISPEEQAQRIIDEANAEAERIAEEARAQTEQTLSDQETDRRRRANDFMEQNYPWMTPQMRNVFVQEWIRSDSSAQAITEVRNTDDYQQVFDGIYRENGTRKLTESQYLDNIESYKAAVAEVIGDDAVDLISNTRWQKLIKEDVAPFEFGSRVTAVYEGISLNTDQALQAFTEEAGVPFTKEAAILSLIDPTVGDSLLRREIAVAQVRGESVRGGFSLTAERGRELVDAGFADQESARALYSSGRRVVSSLDQAAERFGNPDDDVDISELEDAAFLGDDRQAYRLNQIRRQDQAQFTRGAAARQQGGRRGLTGLRGF